MLLASSVTKIAEGAGAAEKAASSVSEMLGDVLHAIDQRPVVALIAAFGVAMLITAWSSFRSPPRTSSSPLGQPRLLLTEFSVDEQAMRVKIRGRLPGIFAIMAKFAGVNTETAMLATMTRFEFRTSNLAGEVSQIAPTPSIAMIECGFTRPFSALMFAILLGTAAIGLFTAGQPALGLIGLSLCLGMLFLYMLAKRFFIAVQTMRNEAYVLEFRRSFIDKTMIDIDQARRAMALLSKIVELNQGTSSDAMREAQEESERERIREAIDAERSKRNDA